MSIPLEQQIKEVMNYINNEADGVLTDPRYAELYELIRTDKETSSEYGFHAYIEHYPSGKKYA